MRISYFELTLCLKLESAVTQSRTVPSSHDLFSAAFTTIIAESNFQYTQVLDFKPVPRLKQVGDIRSKQVDDHKHRIR